MINNGSVNHVIRNGLPAIGAFVIIADVQAVHFTCLASASYLQQQLVKVQILYYETVILHGHLIAADENVNSLAFHVLGIG